MKKMKRLMNEMSGTMIWRSVTKNDGNGVIAIWISMTGLCGILNWKKKTEFN